MFARFTAKAVFAASVIAMAFFGIGLLGMALASALVSVLGAPGAYAVTGAVLLLPPLVWALIVHTMKIRKPKPQPDSELTRVLLGAVARETPWLAVIGAVVAGGVNMFLSRNKRP